MEACPGARFIRQPKPELFKCPECGSEVEIWSDEMRRKCPGCGTTVTRFQDGSCLEWCRLAEECVGRDAYSAFMTNRLNTMRARLIEEVRNTAENEKSGEQQAERARRTADWAGELLKTEDGDHHLLIPASILFFLPEDTDEGSAGINGKSRNRKPVDTIRKILLRHGMRMEAIDEICRLLSPEDLAGTRTNNSRVLHDAVLLAELDTGGKNSGKTGFLTDTGGRFAAEQDR